MSNITRLPVQHPEHPHCPVCGVELPAFADASITAGGLKGATLEAVTFHIKCQCGAQLDLQRKVKQ